MSVARDSNSAAQQCGGVTSKSWSHTSAGSNPYVRVHVGASNVSAITTCTYGGTAMPDRGNITNAGGELAAIRELVNPATGSQTIVLTPNGTMYGACGSTSYTGVDQSTPSDTAQTAIVNYTPGATSVSTTVTSATDNMVTSAMKTYVQSGAPANPTLNAGSVLFQDDDGSFNEEAGASEHAGTASVAVQWNGPEFSSWCLVASDINAAGAAASNLIKTQNINQAVPRAAYW